MPCCMWKCVYSYFQWCRYFQDAWVSFVLTDEFSGRVTKNTSHSTFLFFDLFLTQWIMAVLSRRCKPDNSESHNSLKLRPFRIFAWIKLPCHSCSVWDKLRWLNRFWQSLCEVYRPLIQKDSITHRHGITHRHVCEGRTLLSSYWSPFLCLCTVFDAISSNIDEVLSVNS